LGGKLPLHMSISNSTTRFSDRVEDYVKYRPHYPEAVVSFLKSVYSFGPSWVVADVGSGTGISTEMFLRNGNEVYGVEPNEPMRSKAEQLLAGYMEGGEAAGGVGAAGGGGRFVSIDGTAEATKLADASVDMVVAGQAFHWFDSAKSRIEFIRILRVSGHGGIVALMWNERLMTSPFEREYEELILRYSGDYTTINHKNVDRGRIADFFYPVACRLDQFPNEQLFDFAGLKGRLLSSSYIPKEGPLAGKMLTDLEALFARHQSGGIVRVRYDTKLYTGVLKP
jgi:SAM-dependent methyltransferase